MVSFLQCRRLYYDRYLWCRLFNCLIWVVILRTSVTPGYVQIVLRVCVRPRSAIVAFICSAFLFRFARTHCCTSFDNPYSRYALCFLDCTSSGPARKILMYRHIRKLDSTAAMSWMRCNISSSGVGHRTICEGCEFLHPFVVPIHFSPSSFKTIICLRLQSG